MKDKNHMIISVDDRKNIWQNSTSIYDQNSQKSGYKRNLPQHNKGRFVIYDKPTANIIPNGEKQKAFPLRSGTRQGYPPLPLLFNIVLEVLATEIIQGKEIKSIKIRKEEVKLSLFANNMLLFIENLKDATKKKLLDLINEFSKVAR